MAGHGHVTPNPDGSKCRCGGPGLCPECAAELLEKHKANPPEITVELPPTAVPRDAVKAYEVQAKQAHEVFVRAFEVFNDQRKHYGDPVSVESLDVALRALELKTRLTGLIHGV